MIREYIVNPILFLILLPFLIIFALIGYRSCWQCHKSKHRFQMKKYKLKLFKDTNELVCKECHEILTESR